MRKVESRQQGTPAKKVKLDEVWAAHCRADLVVWYGILEFNVPLDTAYVISETTTLSSDVHLPFSNGRPAT